MHSPGLPWSSAATLTECLLQQQGEEQGLARLLLAIQGVVRSVRLVNTLKFFDTFDTLLEQKHVFNNKN